MSAFGVEHSLVSKAEKVVPRSSGDPSGGRRLAHHFFGVYHTAATSPKGRRGKNVARDIGSAAAGAAPGAILAGTGVAAARRPSKVAIPLIVGGAGLSAGGAALARQANLGSMNRKGYLKAEEKQK